MTDILTPPTPNGEPSFRLDSMPPPPPPGAAFTTPPPPKRAETSKRRRWLGILGHIMFVVGGVALSLQIDSGVMTAVVVLFVILAPFEKLYPRQKGQKWRRPLAANDISFALMNPLLNVVGGIAFILIGALSLFWLPGLAFRPLVALIPVWALPIVAFAMFDFLGYWTHRWAHEVPFLWRFHAVHHSPEHMDWVSGFRIHPFDGILIGPAVLFLLAAGFDAELTGVLAIVQIILGLGLSGFAGGASTGCSPIPSSTTGTTPTSPTPSATTTPPVSRCGTRSSAPSSCRSTRPVVVHSTTGSTNTCPETWSAS